MPRKVFWSLAAVLSPSGNESVGALMKKVFMERCVESEVPEVCFIGMLDSVTLRSVIYLATPTEL